MAILYVNQQTGADANSGASWALAKKTLASANTAASTGDTVYAHGIFTETMPTKALLWIAFGYAVVDGGGVRSGDYNNTANGYINGFTFKSHTDYGLRPHANLALENVTFLLNPVGFQLNSAVLVGGTRFNLTGCQFISNTTRGFYSDYNLLNIRLLNCVFAGQSEDIKLDYVTTTTLFALNRCAFSGNGTMLNIGAAGCLSADSNFNVYNFASAARQCLIGGVAKTTLATWQAALTSPCEQNSIDRAWDTNGDVGDYANGVLRPNPASFLLTAGPGSTPIGLPLPGVTLSNNKNASLWTGGIFTNTVIDGSGNLVLTGGAGTSGTWQSDVIDFGAAINAKVLEIALSGEAAALPYVDYDTADSPGYLNVRVRGSNSAFLKTDVSPAWVIVPRRAEIGAYMSNALRYWQVELTLRS